MDCEYNKKQPDLAADNGTDCPTYSQSNYSLSCHCFDKTRIPNELPVYISDRAIYLGRRFCKQFSEEPFLKRKSSYQNLQEESQQYEFPYITNIDGLDQRCLSLFSFASSRLEFLLRISRWKLRFGTCFHPAAHPLFFSLKIQMDDGDNNNGQHCSNSVNPINEGQPRPER
jgi:hypothetical protein